MNENIEFVSKISKEILAIKFELNKPINYHLEKFYSIMRKYGIKQGAKNGPGVLRDNPEWTICQDLFLNSLVQKIQISFLLKDAPKDLKHY